MGREKENIVLFPFLAQGHLLPFLSLATLLERRTPHTVTIVTTPLNAHALRSSLPPASEIRIVSLPFDPTSHGLPTGAENTDALPFHLIVNLMEAFSSLRPSFLRYISALPRPPLCIISDFFNGWTVDIARQIGVFHSVFSTGSAYGTACVFSLWLNLPHNRRESPAGDVNESEQEFYLPDFPEAGAFHRSQLSAYLRAADGSDPWSRFLQREFSLSLSTDGFLLNTTSDMESIGIDWFRRKTSNRPCWTIGPLCRKGGGRKDGSFSSDDCVSWLNLHPSSSVLFISFGSQNTISATQMLELASGLEESGRPFIWVVRPPIGNDINGEFHSCWLPEGYEERVAGRKQGLLVRRWAPQLEILSHESTGAFLSHCGWNSVLESLIRGVPLMGWPIASEQYYNSKMLVDLGVCVEVCRGICSEVEKGGLKEAIEMVMGSSEKGREMRIKAGKIREVMEAAVREEEGFKGSSVAALDDFIATASSSAENFT